MKIIRAGLERFDDIIGQVTALLAELREEREDSAGLDTDRIRAAWEANTDRFTVFLAVGDDDRPIGVITLSECFAFYAGGRYGVINELYVIPDDRSRRMGKMLLEAVKEEGRARGWQRIDVTAPAGEKWARTVRFYEREGFVFTGPKLKFILT